MMVLSLGGGVAGTGQTTDVDPRRRVHRGLTRCPGPGQVAAAARALYGVVADPLPDVGQPVGPMRLLRLPEPLGDTHGRVDALRVPPS